MNWKDWRAPILALLLATAAPAIATAGKPSTHPWANTALSPDRRASLLVAQMTQDEKLRLVIGAFGRTQPGQYTPPKAARPNSAGYVPGIPRLGVPPLWETDAGMGVATQRTIVVAETGGPILMPWLDQVGAVLETWYPGTRGGEAIARLLFGEVDPSGRLPISFPRGEHQLPRPRLDGDPKAPDAMFAVDYSEGAAVGYKWYDRQGLEPLFPFGYGLSYTRFAYDGLRARAEGAAVTIAFNVRNVGGRAGKDTPQVYVGPRAGGWEAPRRLAGWRKVSLKPGRAQHVTLTVDPRLLATYDSAAQVWRIAPGDYEISLGASSRSLTSHATVTLAARTLPATWPGR